MLEVKEDKIRLTKRGIDVSNYVSANSAVGKDFEAFNNSETNIKHWINKKSAILIPSNKEKAGMRI